MRRKGSMPGQFYQQMDDKYHLNSSTTTPVSRIASKTVLERQQRLQTHKGLLRNFSDYDKSSFSDVEPRSLKGVESLAGFSRFSKLLKSLRSSRPTSIEYPLALSAASSESPPSIPGVRRPSIHQESASLAWNRRSIDQGEHSSSDRALIREADSMLWRKRSPGSLHRHEDTRRHVINELYDTEANYVENLKLMVQKYMRPLKQPIECTLIEPALVDEIFYKIPEILGHHELFYAALHSRMKNWGQQQKIGDVILDIFTKQSVIDTYISFINNWKAAKDAIAQARTRPAFTKYYERCSREHKNKLTFEALLIMPVQRIPRYELLLKGLLKHTPIEHPDHNLLLLAEKEIHELAVKIDHVEQEAGMCEQMQQRLREIEAIVDGLDDLVSSDRIFHRYDLVSVAGRVGKKERCLFLVSDQLLVTSVKRKSTGALRKSASATTTQGADFLDNNKFRLLMKISLDDLEIGRSRHSK